MNLNRDNTNNLYLNAKIVPLLVLYFAPFYYYFGSFRVGFILFYAAGAVCFLFYACNSKFDLHKLGWLLFLTGYIVCLLLSDSSLVYALSSLRLYFGFVLFYALFLVCPRTSLTSYSFFLAFIVIAEKLVLLVKPDLIAQMPNYQIESFSVENAASAIGGVHSFGGNRTVTGVLMLGLFIHLDQKRFPLRFFVLLASILAFSGTVLFLLLVYAVYKVINGEESIHRRAYFYVLLAGLGYLLVSQFIGAISFHRFSIEYVDFIYRYKLDQLNVFLDNPIILDLLFGNMRIEGSRSALLEPPAVVGDFALLDFAHRFGIIMALLFICSLLYASQGQYFLPLFFILIGSLHYPAFFSFPGQVICGFMLANGRHEFKK